MASVATVMTRALIAANLPVVSVRFPSPDRTTWTAELAASATPQQRATAASILAGSDLAAPSSLSTVANDDLAARLAGDAELRALVMWLAQRYGLSVASLRAQVAHVGQGGAYQDAPQG